MANPNLKNLTSVFGENASIADVPITPTSIVTCNNNNLLKVNSLYVSNIDGVNSASVTVDLYSGTSILSYFTRNLNIGSGSTISIITSESPVYLTEGQSLRLTSSASGDLSAIVSYEKIS